MVAAVYLISSIALPQIEVQEAEAILNRVLDVSLRSSMGRPEHLEVQLSNLKLYDQGKLRFELDNDKLHAVFLKSPVRLQHLQISIPFNRRLIGQPTIPKSDATVIATRLAQMLMFEPYQSGEPIISGYDFRFAGMHYLTPVAAQPLTIKLDPWSAAPVVIDVPEVYAQLVPPDSWKAGISEDEALKRAIEAYAATEPLPMQSIASNKLMLKLKVNGIPSWQRTRRDWQLAPYYDVSLSSFWGDKMWLTSIKVNAVTGVPESFAQFDTEPPHPKDLPDSFLGYTPGGSMKLVGTDDELAVGAQQQGAKPNGRTLSIVLRDGPKRLILAKAFPSSRLLEILGETYPYFGRIDEAKLKGLKKMALPRPPK